MTKRRWFRVRLDSQGRVVSCEPTDGAPAEDGSGFYYVLASSSVDAQASAYELFKAKDRKRVAERRQRNLKAGLCRCGRKPMDGSKYCSVCRERDLVNHERRKAAASGRDLPPLKSLPPKIASKLAREERERRLRLSVLLEVRNEMRLNPSGFAIWLNAQIVEAAGSESTEVAA